jgi:hypothetical protein
VAPVKIFNFEALALPQGEQALQKLKDIHQTLEAMSNHVNKIVRMQGMSHIHAHIATFFDTPYCISDVRDNTSIDEGTYLPQNRYNRFIICQTGNLRFEKR